MAFGISAGAAALIGGGVAAAGSIIGGRAGAKASERAASTQAAAADRAAELQYQQFQEQKELQAPFREAGLAGQNKLLQYLGLTPEIESRGAILNRLSFELPAWGSMSTQQRTDAINAEIQKQRAGAATAQRSPEYGALTRDFGMKDFQADPGYAFRLSEGTRALDRTAAARGGLLSGSTLRGAQRFGQDLASQEYQNAFNRYQVNRGNKLNPLQSLLGSGQSATNVLGSAGQNYATQAGENYMGAANARASGYIGSANALSNAFGGVSNAFTNYNLMNALNRPAYTPSAGGYSTGGGVNAFL
jgi:hypothetical protein